MGAVPGCAEVSLVLKYLEEGVPLAGYLFVRSVIRCVRLHRQPHLPLQAKAGNRAYRINAGSNGIYDYLLAWIWTDYKMYRMLRELQVFTEDLPQRPHRTDDSPSTRTSVVTASRAHPPEPGVALQLLVHSSA